MIIMIFKEEKKNLSAQAQKFGIFKKSSLWVSVVRVQNYLVKVQVKVSKVVTDHNDLLTQSRKIFFWCELFQTTIELKKN